MASQFGRLKALNHMEELKGLARGKPVPPICLEIDPADGCNHACYFCYYGEAGTGGRTTKSIERELMMNVIKEAADMGVKAVTFTGGGEPLLNKHTIDAIALTREVGMNAGLVTNGTLLRDVDIGVLVANCDFVRFSVDAGSAESYNQTHLPKSPKYDFDCAMRNLDALAKRKHEAPRELTIGVGYLVDENNASEAPAMAERVRGMGVDYIQFRPLYFPDKPEWTAGWYSGLSIVEDAQRFAAPGFDVFVIKDRANEIEIGERPYAKCLSHALIGIVGATGKIYFCSPYRGLDHAEIGDLHDSSFRDIWYGDRRMKLLDEINVQKCPNCRYQVQNTLLDDMTRMTDSQIKDLGKSPDIPSKHINFI